MHFLLLSWKVVPRLGLLLSPIPEVVPRLGLNSSLIQDGGRKCLGLLSSLTPPPPALSHDKVKARLDLLSSLAVVGRPEIGPVFIADPRGGTEVGPALVTLDCAVSVVFDLLLACWQGKLQPPDTVMVTCFLRWCSKARSTRLVSLTGQC